MHSINCAHAVFAMRKKQNNKTVVIYQAKNGAIQLRGDVAHETVWATQAQIAEAFDAERSVVTKHIRNILKDKELDERAVCAKFAHTADDGKTYQVQHYNLDIILSVGYRTNSKRAIEFRQWATKTLREHITKGYTINRKQIQKNYREFQKTIESIQQLLPAHGVVDPHVVLELVKEFSSTWVSLDAYDKGTLKPVGTSRRSVQVSGTELLRAIADLRLELIHKGEAEKVFAHERSMGSVEGILGNVMQSLGGKPVICHCGRTSGTPAVFHGQEPSVC